MLESRMHGQPRWKMLVAGRDSRTLVWDRSGYGTWWSAEVLPKIIILGLKYSTIWYGRNCRYCILFVWIHIRVSRMAHCSWCCWKTKWHVNYVGVRIGLRSPSIVWRSSHIHQHWLVVASGAPGGRLLVLSAGPATHWRSVVSQFRRMWNYWCVRSVGEGYPTSFQFFGGHLLLQGSFISSHVQVTRYFSRRLLVSLFLPFVVWYLFTRETLEAISSLSFLPTR